MYRILANVSLPAYVVLYHTPNVKSVKCEVHVRDFILIGKIEEGQNLLNFVLKSHTVALTCNKCVLCFLCVI